MSEELFNQVLDKVGNLSGINSIYLIDSNYRVTSSHNFTETNTYQENISTILKSKDLLNNISPNFSEPFHTFTFLNESGLILITKLSESENTYMVIIAGESDPVDLINLLKICKESRAN